MLRYAFRVNSTKMRRSVWQSKNLPRGENSSWMATFIAPLYTQTYDFNCKMLNHNMLLLGHCGEMTPDALRLLNLPRDLTKLSPHTFCATCFMKDKIELKKCSRCMTVSYCSTTCQKDHWITHRPKCTSSST